MTSMRLPKILISSHFVHTDRHPESLLLFCLACPIQTILSVLTYILSRDGNNDFCYSLSATVTIACMFTPKLYIIILHPEKNIRQSMMKAPGGRYK